MEIPTLDAFTAEAAQWLSTNAVPRTSTVGDAGAVPWGEGEFSVSVFHSLEFDEERELIERAQAWTTLKATKGYHAIMAPVADGGLGLDRSYARAFSQLEAKYDTPPGHEVHGVTTRLVAPTIQVYGTEQQRKDHVGPFLAAEELCCQLFSEPSAGSDLASLACRAVRDGDEWIVNGQKVWSSGAQFADWGELIARSDADLPKHKGMTAFIIPLDLPGIEVRPIKQMSGGSSFCEVFFTDVRVPDSTRLGPVGEGWKVALTTLGFERDHSDSGGGGRRVGGSWPQLLATAQALDVTGSPAIRQQLARIYSHHRIENWVNRRATDLRQSGAAAGPEGSLGKLLWTEGMTLMSDVVSDVLGARLLADTGEWGTYAWAEHVLGAPGFRIAGGSDETQRNIIGERVLGLPAEPRLDKNLPWRDIPR
jgi:alkylation response protein AidB-like acyl-CoA dehydrogenase